VLSSIRIHTIKKCETGLEYFSIPKAEDNINMAAGWKDRENN
jgi:hypothetical protein